MKFNNLLYYQLKTYLDIYYFFCNSFRSLSAIFLSSYEDLSKLRVLRPVSPAGIPSDTQTAG